MIPHLVLAKAARFLDLLDRWNATHALTALPPEARWEELILDACALLPSLDALPPGASVVDFGTGMGIPATVLALARPDLQITALDKSRKKNAFVRQVALELQIGNLLPVLGRAEVLPSMHADMGTAKAVGNLELLCSWWTRHGKASAPLLLLKGDDWRAEACPTDWAIQAAPYTLPARGERFVLRLERKPGP